MRLLVAAASALLAGLACATATPDASLPVAAAAAEGMCAEHGVLEAVCTQCNPALIPVFQAKGDWCPEHGFPMSFCPVHHPERGGRPVGEVAAPGGPPVDGTKVRFRTRQTAERAGLRTAAATRAPDEGGVQVVAHLTWDATRHAVVGARADGVVQAIRADVGTRVSAGDPLAVLQSATAMADRSQAEAARARVARAEQAVDRKRRLEGVVSRAEVARAEQDLAEARADVRAAEVAAGYTLTAPIDGVVIRRDVTVGAGVEAGRALFEVVDPSRLWADLDVPEAELGRVRVGQAVTLWLDGQGDRAFTGALEFLSPSIDPDTRTALGRLAVDNTDGALRANQYGRASIAVGGDREALTVPAAAVQRVKGVDVVFVQTAVDTFETRRVVVLSRAGDRAVVSGALADGDALATDGSFLLKTELMQDSIGAGCCDVE